MINRSQVHSTLNRLKLNKIRKHTYNSRVLAWVVAILTGQVFRTQGTALFHEFNLIPPNVDTIKSYAVVASINFNVGTTQ